VSQLFFAFIAKGSRPDAVVVNIVASAIATAGASQTGDLAYDFKIGQLVGAPPQSQMYGQVIGSVFGAIVSAATYKLYTTRFEIPGPFLQIPSSFLSISTAKLMLGRGLPEGAPCFALGFAVVFFILTIIKTVYAGHFWQRFIPSGVSFAVGKSFCHLVFLFHAICVNSIFRHYVVAGLYTFTDGRWPIYCLLDPHATIKKVFDRGNW
jgi:uncharacterized oligopeptide transporter (OPT) family protein